MGVDKSACLDALRQLEAKDVIIDAGLQGLLTGSAVDTSSDNIAWVTDMVVKTRTVAGVGERLNLLGSWVVSGVLSVPQFVGLWNEVNEELADGGAADHPAHRPNTRNLGSRFSMALVIRWPAFRQLRSQR